MKYSIIPAILEHSEDAIIKKIEIARAFSTHLHIDIVDASFSNKPTMPSPQIFAPYTNELFLELHMMVTNPKALVRPFSVAGFKRFIGHVEYMQSQEDFLHEVKKTHREAFLALDLNTPEGALEEKSITLLSGILCLGVNAGKSGQIFNDKTLSKIAKLRSAFPKIGIEADGGMNTQTLPRVKQAGANLFAASHALFANANPGLAFQNLQNTVCSIETS